MQHFGCFPTDSKRQAAQQGICILSSRLHQLHTKLYFQCVPDALQEWLFPAETLQESQWDPSHPFTDTTGEIICFNQKTSNFLFCVHCLSSVYLLGSQHEEKERTSLHCTASKPVGVGAEPWVQKAAAGLMLLGRLYLKPSAPVSRSLLLRLLTPPMFHQAPCGIKDILTWSLLAGWGMSWYSLPATANDYCFKLCDYLIWLCPFKFSASASTLSQDSRSHLRWETKISRSYFFAKLHLQNLNGPGNLPDFRLSQTFSCSWSLIFQLWTCLT